MATGTAEGIEEERRLLYVAMTRARDELHLLQPERFHTMGQARAGDRYVRVPRTRFITEAMLDRFDIVLPADPCSQASPPLWTAPLPQVNVAAELRGMWD
jgi:DNA helicase-2/ATP-dependent DNA helicase PcrA